MLCWSSLVPVLTTLPHKIKFNYNSLVYVGTHSTIQQSIMSDNIHCWIFHEQATLSLKELTSYTIISFDYNTGGPYFRRNHTTGSRFNLKMSYHLICRGNSIMQKDSTTVLDEMLSLLLKSIPMLPTFSKPFQFDFWKEQNRTII